MQLIIDGYNLLHASDVEGGPSGTLEAARLGLIERVAGLLEPKERSATTIVFDAAGAPPGLPQQLSFDGMAIRFARPHLDADAVIEEMIDACAAPAELTVVSGDHRLHRAARRRGATCVDSGVWLRERAKRMRDSTLSASAAKPEGPASKEEVRYWMAKFGHVEAELPERKHHGESRSGGIFPPGYGEDVLREETEE